MGVISKALDWAIKTAEDAAHGYDQSSRWGPDYDCSSLVISAYKQAGVPLTATYTGNMRSDFLANGFKDVTSAVNLSNSCGLIAGDVLLNIQNHTAMAVGNGKIVQASINELGKTTGGKTGDQTGREIYIGWYYNFPWDCVLRYEGENDGDKPGDSSPTAQNDSIIDAKEEEDYYTVKSGDTLWAIAERFLGDGSLYPLLQQLNGIGGTSVYPGMILMLHPEGLEPEIPTNNETPAQDPAEVPTGSYMLALKVLKRGDHGDTIRQLQRLLIATGYKMPKYGADGDYGEETENAVKKFQKDNGLTEHGAVDKSTMLKLLGE